MKITVGDAAAQQFRKYSLMLEVETSQDAQMLHTLARYPGEFAEFVRRRAKELGFDDIPTGTAAFDFAAVLDAWRKKGALRLM